MIMKNVYLIANGDAGIRQSEMLGRAGGDEQALAPH